MSSLYVQPSAATRLPKGGIWQRGLALGIDFILAWLPSGILGADRPAVAGLVFVVTWFCLRVLLVAKNQGQSLGHWALDLKVVDNKFGKLPGMTALAKREGVVGLGALLTMFALGNLWRNGEMALLILPLAVDCAVALIDRVHRQAFHDRLAQTLVIYTYRGYSLDRKLQKLFAQARRRVK